MIKTLITISAIGLLVGCENYQYARQPMTPEEQAVNLQMMQLGAQLLYQAGNPAPARQPVNCTSYRQGYYVNTNCY